MKTTRLDNQRVVLTKGMVNGATGKTIYGVFACPADARSIDADQLALGTVGASQLTDEQIEIARYNTAIL